MVQTSFEPGKRDIDAEDPQAAADLYDGETTAMVPARSPLAAIGEVAGDIGQKDVYLPRLQIIQGVGPLSRQFKQGDIVLSKEVCIASEGEELTLVVLSLSKYFQERFAKFDINGPRPLKFATEKEALDAGLKTEWGSDNTPPTAEPVADITFLIRRPDKVDSPVFAMPMGGKFWCAAIWTVQRTSYNRAAKRIFTAKAIELSATGLLGGLWTLATRDAVVKGNSIKVPILTLVGRNDEATITEIKALFGKA